MNSAAEIIAGGCAVWPLPQTSECARTARRRIREVVPELVPERFDDSLEMASELATNAWLHGIGGRGPEDRDAPAAGLSELAIYRRGAENEAELVVTVFDPSSDLKAIPDPAPSLLTSAPDKPLAESLPPEVLDALLERLPDKPADEPLMAIAELPPQRWSGGRGLAAVQELAGGRCGFRRARSRLGARSGKVAWFALPISAASRAAIPPQISIHPAETAEALESRLTARGVGGVIRKLYPDVSVISAPSVNVWCHNRYLSLNSDKHALELSISDFVEAVEQIIEITEDRRHITSLRLARTDEVVTPLRP